MLTNEKIKGFFSSFGRDGIDMGEIEFSENEINIPDSIKVDFNGQLKYFYSHLKFTELITGGEFFIQIFPSERLESSQVGWRWIKNKNGEIVENTTSWRDNWVVFGDRNGDAIYCDTSTEDNSVYGTIQGRRHFLLANSVSDFIERY